MSNLSNHFPTHEAITMCPTCPTISRIGSGSCASVQPVQPFYESDGVKKRRVSNLSNLISYSTRIAKRSTCTCTKYIVQGDRGDLVGQVGHHRSIVQATMSSRGTSSCGAGAVSPVERISVSGRGRQTRRVRPVLAEAIS